MPKNHDVKIWERIVEAFAHIGVKGNPTAIATKLGMAQTSVRDWQFGNTTPSRANILAIAEKTGYRSGYLEDAELPKKKATFDDPRTNQLLAIWEELDHDNKVKLFERASALFESQSDDPEESRELQRR